MLIGLAAVGLVFSLGISRVPAANPRKEFRANFLGDLWQQMRVMRRDRVLWLACLGNIYFWFIGQLLQQGVIDYGENVLQVGELRTTYMLAVLAIGIGLGSFAAGYLSGGKIEYGLVPLGSLGLSVFAALLWQPGLSFGRILAVVGALGFFGGFFIVPISAILQHRPAREEKGVMLAAANLLSSGGLFVAAGVYWVLAVWLQLGPRGVFAHRRGHDSGGDGLCGLAAARLAAAVRAVGADAYRLSHPGGWPRQHSRPRAARCSSATTSRSWTRCCCSPPPTGLCASSCTRAFTSSPGLSPLRGSCGAIPISSELRPREMLQALRTASEAIQNGEVVCIFAEGQITRIGHLLPFRRGFERIMKDVEAPIIPVALDGVWGSIFSFDKGPVPLEAAAAAFPIA